MNDNKAVTYSIILIGIVLLVLILKTLQSFLRPFTIAILLLFLLIPLINYSHKKKIPFWIFLTGIFIILILIMSLLTVLLSNGIDLNQNNNFENQIDLKTSIEMKTNYFLNTSKTFFSKIKLTGLFEIIESYITPEKIINIISKSINSILVGLSTILQESFLVILFLMFLLSSHQNIEKNLLKCINKKHTKTLKNTISRIKESVPNYLVAKSLISLATAFISAAILYLFGANLFIITLSSIIIFILNFIPNLGSTIAVILVSLLYLTDNGMSIKFIILFILLIIIQITIGNYIEPKYFGKKFKMSPIVVLLSLFLWYWIWGLSGMILAVPLTSIIKIILENIKSAEKFTKLLE